MAIFDFGSKFYLGLIDSWAVRSCSLPSLSLKNWSMLTYLSPKWRPVLRFDSGVATVQSSLSGGSKSGNYLNFFSVPLL